MPAIPAPSTNTDAPFGAPCKSIGPRDGDSAAIPKLLIAWYIAALPADTPIMRSSSRRLSAGVVESSCIVSPELDLRDPSRSSTKDLTNGYELVPNSYHSYGNATSGIMHAVSRAAIANAT